MIVTPRRVGRAAELYYDQPVPDPDALRAAAVDVVECIGFRNPLPSGTWIRFPTPMIELRQPVEVLFDRLDRDVRYAIRRADREGTAWAVQADPAATAEFLADYEPFRRARNLSAMSEPRLQALADAGALFLTRTADAHGVTLTWHCYITVDGTARLLHSVAPTRAEDRSQLVGRANRFHHWRDMLELIDRGCGRLDLGGWYEGKTDEQLLQINRFKAQFGGELVLLHNGVLPRTWRGRLIVVRRRRSR